VPDPDEHIRIVDSTAIKIAEYMLPRPWWLVSYDTPALLTSDEPLPSTTGASATPAN
jgi:hypothetical protein